MTETQTTTAESEQYLAAYATTNVGAVADMMGSGIDRDAIDDGAITDPEAEAVLRVIFDLSADGKLTSHNVVRAELKERGLFDDLGGHEWWSDWVGVGMAVSDFDYHLDRVLTAWEVRQSLDAIDDTESRIEQSAHTTAERRDAIRDLTGRLIEAQARREDTVLRPEGMRTRAASEIEHGDGVLYVKTGIWTFDRIYGGLPSSRITIGAARPNHGKTVTAETIAVNCALRWARNDVDKQVLYFDAENQQFEKSLRMLTILANRGVQHPDNGIGAHTIEKIIQGDVEMTDDAERRIDTGMERLSEIDSHLVVDHIPSPTGQAVRARAIAEQSRRDVGLIIFDYAELTGEKARTRNEKVTLITESLHALARELGVPVLILSQLSRSADSRDEPLLSDLSWSDALAKLARMVWMVVHPHTKWATTDGDADDEPSRSEFNCYVRKNKGAVGMCELRMLPSCLRVYDWRDPELDMSVDDELPF